MIQQIGLYLMSFLYTLAGINHFIKPKMYLAIMPPYIPAHGLMVMLSGIAEIMLGLGLLSPVTRPWAAWGIILLLIAIFPANVYMLTSGKFSKIAEWLLWLRLPLQFFLIWWAYLYTKG
ncbi:DoxX family protein [Arcicella aquatica]|uniref:DoxX family protein n=1 Tax=Arcicella aquatica TaxID=217141 RepID=UPI00389923A2